MSTSILIVYTIILLQHQIRGEYYCPSNQPDRDCELTCDSSTIYCSSFGYTFTCNDNYDCTLNCIGGGTCNQNNIINCPNNGRCFVNCDGDHACLGITINCAPNDECHVLCDDTRACMNANIIWPTNPTVNHTLICDPTNDQTSQNDPCLYVPTFTPTTDITFNPTPSPTNNPSPAPTVNPIQSPILSLHIPSPRPTFIPTVSDKSESEVFSETSTTLQIGIDKVTNIDSTSHLDDKGVMIIIGALGGGVVFFCIFIIICCVLHSIKKKKHQFKNNEANMSNINIQTGTEMPATNVKIGPKLKLQNLARSLSDKDVHINNIHYSPQATHDMDDGHFPDIVKEDDFAITVNAFHRINTELTASTPGDHEGRRGIIIHSPMDNDTPIDMEKESYLVKQWLTYTVKLPRYYTNFIENGYESMQFIKEIQSKQELLEIGIHIKGHQTAIIGAIRRLRKEHDDTKGN